LQEDVEHPDQGGFTRSGESHDDEGLARCDLERHVDDRRGHVEIGDGVTVATVRESLDGGSRLSSEHLVQVVCAYCWHGLLYGLSRPRGALERVHRTPGPTRGSLRESDQIGRAACRARGGASG